MEYFKRIWNFIKFDTYGNIALASFLVCSVSGIALAIPFDVGNAYDSISIMLIANPGAVFFRNVHYWSAQLFLIFTLSHIWEHIRIGSLLQVKSGIWFRLVLSILFVFFVMLSGFMLKADADSLQALQVFKSLLTSIPFIGTFLTDIILGQNDNLQLIYIHHAVTATIILFIVVFEHSRIIWAKKMTFLISIAIITLMAFFIQTPFQDQGHLILKGPWYFVGLQELLHYLGSPVWMWLFFILLFFAFWLLRFVRGNYYRIFAKSIAILAILYLGLTIIGFYFRGENWEWQLPWKHHEEVRIFPLEVELIDFTERFDSITSDDIPVVLGKREACMLCHQNVTGFSPAHDPNAIGCTSCHLGHPFSLNKKQAHQSMISIPGNLAGAAQTCGTAQCHPDIPARVNLSLMTTNSGIVSVDRFVFGETQSPDVLSPITKIGHGPSDTHLRNLCSKCHLENEKTETGYIGESSRGGGCLACHLNYTKVGVEQHQNYIANNKQESSLPLIHPSLDIKISNDHCFGCHSRSGRISTNYEGWHETLLDEADIQGKDNYRVLEDKRVFEYVGEDTHHKSGMDCIDCHSSYEVMGDGNIYLHEESAVKVQCEDCHFISEPKTISYDQLDAESKKIFDLRKFASANRKMIKGKESGMALVNTYLKNDSAFLVVKNTGKILPMLPTVSICTKGPGHQNLTCSSCHTSWAPQCIGCHNAFKKNSLGYDLLEKKEVKGSWVEYVGQFFAEAPALGVREGESLQIIPAIPGMVLTIDFEGFIENESKENKVPIIFQRLYAPAAPHTISSQGRNCKSCHNNSLAIGYGRGKLNYKIIDGHGIWEFIPAFAANKYDGLPEDAWIGFLKEPGTDLKLTTRSDFRPFSLKEQKRILTVGSCLTCHDENSTQILNSLQLPFENYIQTVSEACIIPEYKEAIDLNYQD